MNDSQPEAGCMVSTETRLKRAWRKILGAYGKHMDHPAPNEVCLLPERIIPGRMPGQASLGYPSVSAKDAIYVNVTVKISWADLLRCALGAVLYVKSITYCENPPGMIKTITDAHAVLE